MTEKKFPQAEFDALDKATDLTTLRERATKAPKSSSKPDPAHPLLPRGPESAYHRAQKARLY